MLHVALPMLTLYASYLRIRSRLFFTLVACVIVFRYVGKQDVNKIPV